MTQHLVLAGIKHLDIESDALPLHAPQCFTFFIFQSDQDLLYSMVDRFEKGASDHTAFIAYTIGCPFLAKECSQVLVNRLED